MKKTIIKLFKIIVKPFTGRGWGGLFNQRLSKWLSRIIVFFFNPIEIDEGNKLYLSSTDGISFFLKSNDYQGLTREVFKGEIKKGGVVLDIGAYLGYHTLVAAKLVGPEGKVFAFEPAPANCDLIKKSVAENDYQNVILVQKAVGGQAGKRNLYLFEEQVYNRMFDYEEANPSKNLQPIEIETVSLNDYFKDYQRDIDLIKIDVLGAEGEIIQGMTSLLEKNKSLKIIMMFNPVRVRKHNLDPLKCLNILKGMSFKIYKIDSELKFIDRMETLIEFGKTSSLFCQR